MIFRALATDYDGTIAENGRVPGDVVEALRRLRTSGRRLVLVTGRQLEDLRHVFAEVTLFDRIVAENGGVLLDPACGKVRILAPPPPVQLIETLMRRRVEPIAVGHTIVATWVPHEAVVLHAVEELGLELKIVFNKGAIMVLPRGVDKASGLAAALRSLRLSPFDTVGVGDAENDDAFLAGCGCSAAVANALASVKQRCDLVLSSAHGAGVIELAERMLDDDGGLVPVQRQGLLLGTTPGGTAIHLARGRVLLVTGGSGAGKSTYVTLLAERMAAQGAQFCIIDPEGDYEELEPSLAVGRDKALPSDADLLALLDEVGINLVIGLHGFDQVTRRLRAERLLPLLSARRSETGRPHWLVIDEVQQILPRNGGAEAQLDGAILVTVDPCSIAARMLGRVDAVVAFGSAAAAQIRMVARERDLPVPPAPSHAQSEALFWSVESPDEVQVIRAECPQQEHHRHRGKYAAGDVGNMHAFTFKDQFGEAVGSALNLTEFVQLAEAVGDPIWERHLRAGDYAAWFLDVIRDEVLGRLAEALAADQALSAAETRARVAAAIRSRYGILPASA